MSGTLAQLAMLTLRDPRAAAAQIIAMKLPREVLMSGFVLAVVLNAILFALVQSLAPTPETMPRMMPAALQSPFVVAMLLAGVLLFSIHVLLWAGRAMGGTARIEDIIALITWLQFLRFAAQIVVLALMMLVPLLAALLVSVAMFWGIFILIAFVDQAHGFKSMGKSAMVLLGSVMALFVGLIFFVSILSVLV